jgi:hypothetical protein
MGVVRRRRLKDFCDRCLGQQCSHPEALGCLVLLGQPPFDDVCRCVRSDVPRTVTPAVEPPSVSEKAAEARERWNTLAPTAASRPEQL